MPRTTSSASPASRRRRLWTPEQADVGQQLVRASPAGLAFVHSGGLLPPEERNAGTLWLPGEHLLLIADRIVHVVARIRETQRLINAREIPPDTQGPRLGIFMPPRHGKSELTSRYTPAWFLGTNPELRVILTSYGAALSTGWGRKVRDLVDELGELYEITLDPASSRADDWNLDGRRGGMKTAGVGGAITGIGAHLFIVDDPVKDAADAASEVMQDRAWEWWQGTARTRLMPGAGVIVMQTRWHELDLSGRLLAQDPTRDELGRKLPDGERRDDVDGEEWDVLCLPAIANEHEDKAGQDGYGSADELGREAGEPLWPQMYPLPQLAIIKRAVGRYVFSSQYQQTPTPAEGGIFKRADFRYFKVDPERDMFVLYQGVSRSATHGIDPLSGYDVGRAYVYRFGTADLAFSSKETADYTVLAHWAVTPDKDLLLLDVERVHFETEDLPGVVRAFMELHDLTDMRVESAAYGTKVITNLVRQGLAIRSLEADTDKVTRAIAAVPRYEQTTVYHRLGAPWLDKYERELLAFPNGANDDQVDVYSYAALALPGISFDRPKKNEAQTKTQTGGLQSRDL